MNGPPVPREAAHHRDEDSTAAGHGFRVTERGWIPRNAEVNARMVEALDRRSRRAPDDEVARVTDDVRRLLCWGVVDIDGVTPITDPDRIETVRFVRAVNRVLISGIDRDAKEGLLGRLEHAARTACSPSVADAVAPTDRMRSRGPVMTLREGGFYDTTEGLEAFDNAVHGWRKVSDIVPMNVRWLWPDRVPFGMTTVLGGPPGAGKSTILYDLAAKTSREGQAVLIITAEDHLAAVVRPRLEAASARLDMIHVRTEPLELPADVDVIRGYARDIHAALVIIDPLVAFIGDDVNTHRDHHVRRVLAPLGDMAEATDVALVVVIHTNKGTAGDPLMRISGSIGFTGAARSVLVAVQDPNDDTRCILAVVKSNLARFPTPQAYRIEDALAGTITTSRIKWLGDAPEVDVHDLLAVPDRRERKGDEARAFLIASGVAGMAQPAADLEQNANAAGIAKRTLRRARDELGIPAWRTGFGADGVWWWGRKEAQDIGANPKGPPNRSILAPMELPAETDPQGHIGANGVAAGDGPCPSCGARSSDPGYRGHGEGCPRYYGRGGGR